MKHILFLCLAFVFLLPQSVSAQMFANRIPVSIVNSGDLYTTFNLKSSEIKAQLQDQFTETEISYLQENGNEGNWPIGINDLSAWAENKDFFIEYNAYQIGTVASEGMDYYFILIPFKENQKVQSQMRSDHNFILVMASSAFLGGAGTANEEKVDEDAFEPENEEPFFTTGTTKAGFKYGREAEIIRLSALISTPGLGDGEESFEDYIAKEYGLLLASRMIKFSTEENWPEAISTLDARNANPDKLKKYKLFYFQPLIDFDATILIAPAEENQDLPSGMVSKNDLFFVISNNGFGFLTQEDEDAAINSAWEDQNVAEDVDLANYPLNLKIGEAIQIIDYGKLFSTFGFTTENEGLAFMETTFGSLSDLAILYANEISWPEGINNLEVRSQRPSPLEKYKLTYFGRFGGKVLVGCSLENMRSITDEQYAAEHAIYFVLDANAIAALGDKTASAPISTNPNAGTFESQIKQLLEAYPTSFAPYKGKPLVGHAEKQLFRDEFKCNMAVNGAFRSVIQVNEDDANDVSYLGVFYHDEDSTKAAKMHDMIVAQLVKADFGFIEFEKQDKVDSWNGFGMVTTFTPKRIDAGSSSKYKNVEITVMDYLEINLETEPMLSYKTVIYISNKSE